MSEAAVVIRPYRPSDREAVRAVAMNTGQKGNPTSTYFEDPEISPIMFTDYFTDHEPESCFVAEAQGRVVGYMLATRDARRYFRQLCLRIVPRLLLRFTWKILTLQFRRAETYRTLWWLCFRSWREMPSVDLDLYPARVHINVEKGFRVGVGTQLAQALEAHLLKAGVKGCHGIFAEPEGERRMSLWAQRLFGFTEAAQSPMTLWRGLTGKRWILKLLVRRA